MDAFIAKLGEIDEWGEPITCELDNYNATYFLNSDNDVVVFCFSEKDGTVFAVATSVSDDSDDSVQQKASKVHVDVAFLVDASENESFTFTTKDGSSRDILFSISPTAQIKAKNLPCSVAQINPVDFFSDEERIEACEQYVNTFDFKGLKGYVETYIAETNPKEYDSAYSILVVLDTAIPLVENCIIEYDSFEGIYTLKYKGAEKIGRDVSLVTRLISEDGYFSFENDIGFRASDWVFFERVKIKYSADDIDNRSFDYGDITRDVISGSGIEEYTDYTLPHRPEDIQRFEDAEEIVIRFESDTADKTYDHTLTAAEKNGFVALAKLREICLGLKTLDSTYLSF
jgi:hypothetical protein